jgi:hypothetical protein
MRFQRTLGHSAKLVEDLEKGVRKLGREKGESEEKIEAEIQQANADLRKKFKGSVQ